MNTRLLWASLFCLCGWCATTPAQPGLTNLLVNGGFEQGTAGWQYMSTGAKATGQLDETERHEGGYAYKLTNQSGQAPNLFARIFQVVPGLRPYSTYRVSCWVKGQGCGINWIGGGPGWFTRHQFPQGDFDWRQESFEIESGATPDSYELMVLTESPTKALWVDDIRFELVKVDHAKADTVYADIASKAESLRRRVKDLEEQARGNARLAANSYLRLGTAVARRFIDFAQNGGPDGRTGLVWSQLQLEEVAQVLDETERLVRSGRMALLDWQPLKPGPVRLKDGTFYEGRQPHYFDGYGHFGTVIADLPDFPDARGVARSGRDGWAEFHECGRHAGRRSARDAARAGPRGPVRDEGGLPALPALLPRLGGRAGFAPTATLGGSGSTSSIPKPRRLSRSGLR